MGIAFTCFSIKRIFITINRIVTSDTLIKILIQIFIAFKDAFLIYQRFNISWSFFKYRISSRWNFKVNSFFFPFEGDKIYLLNFISIRTFLLLFFDYTLHITHLALLVILSLSIMCLNKTSESSEESKIIRLVPWLAISISSATADKHIYIGLLFLPLIAITLVRHENSAEIKRFLFKSTLSSLLFLETKNFHLCTSLLSTSRIIRLELCN